jgi:hypothetical protein
MESLIQKVYAQAAGSVFSSVSQSQQSGITTIGGIISNIIQWLIYIAGVLAFAYLVYSGILYITAAGNPDSAKKGQQGIINAVIGIIIIALAYTILIVVRNTATGGLTAPTGN